MKISEDLYFYSKDKPVSFFFGRGFSCNRFAIDQGDEIWLIDAGTSVIGRVKRLLRDIKNDGMDPSKITKVFATHGHGDHMNGFPALSKLIKQMGGHVDLYIHKEDDHFVKGGDEDFVNYLLKAAGDFAKDFAPVPKWLFKFGSKFSMGKAPTNQDTVLFTDGDVFKGNRYSLKMYHTPGHSEGHVCPYLIEKKALFLGDLIDQFFDHKPPVNMPNSDFIAFRNSLKKVSEIDIEIFCSAHGKDIPQGIEYNRKYVHDVIQQLYFGYNRTIELLKQKGEMKLSEFSGKFPKTIWQFQEQKTLPYSICKHLQTIGAIEQKGKKFKICGEIPPPEEL